MPPGHVAVTWGVAATLQRTHPAPLDYRLLALSALAPDLIDKPLALFVFTGAQTSQLIAHSLFLNLGLLCLALLLWRRALPYVLAFNLHLVADRMWYHTESFWWPLYGWNVFWTFKPMNTPETMLSVYLDIVTRYPQVWVIELLAMGYFLWFAAHYQVYRWPVLKRFVLTGYLSHSPSARPVPAPFHAAATGEDRGGASP
jgi:hypothetical protein